MLLMISINAYMSNNRIMNRNMRLYSSDNSNNNNDNTNNNKMNQYCVEIQYCTGCKWLLRSAWLAQELLTTFEKELDQVALKPDKTQKGVFIIKINDNIIWNRKDDSTLGFPEAKVLKQKVRDFINPDINLGHSDKVIEIKQ